MSVQSEQGSAEAAEAQEAARLREAKLQASAQELVERALKLGADEAEAFASGGETTQIGFEESDLKMVQVDEFGSVGLRVVKDRKQGFATTNQLSPEGLAQAAADATELSSLSPPDEHNGLPPTRGAAPRLNLVGMDPLTLSLEETVEAATGMIAQVQSRDPRLSLDKAELSLTRVSQAVVNSLGVSLTESDAHLSTSVFGMAVDGDDVGGFDYWGEATRRQAELEDRIETTVRRFADGALGNLGAGAAETYTGPVLFAPAAMLSVFIGPLLSAASSIAVQRGRSALAGKVGEQIAAASLTIVDDPSDLALNGACSFDREGQPTGRFAVVEAGRLGGLFYNGYAARVDGVESTGHARGGPRGVPGLGPHAIRVEGGTGGSTADLRSSLGKGLLVQRFSGSVDAASGDFSGVAKSARWVENGQIVRSVKETLIAGNVFDLLQGSLILGSTPESLMGSTAAPWALVDGLSVTAG